MPSFHKLSNTRKRHFYYRRPIRQGEFAALHARHRANGRIATIGWARCGNCGHKECWVSMPWFNNDVACSCGGSLTIEFRALRREDAAWRDRKGVIHRVTLDHCNNTLTSCRLPMEHDQRTLESFVGDAAPICLLCVVATTKAA